MTLQMERGTCQGCGQAVVRPGAGAPWRTIYVKSGDPGVCPAVARGGPHAVPRVYCTRQHADGEHDASCMPPADPHNPELRLIRAIFGLCPLCDDTSEHDHPDGPPVRVVVDYGLPGYGPDASNDSYSICETWPDAADELRRRLDESAEGVLLYAESLAEAGDYEAAWNTRKQADDMWLLHDSLDNSRQDAPLYEGDPTGWALTIAQVVAEKFPYDVDPGCRIYAWEDTEGTWAADDEDGYDPVTDPADGEHTAAAYQAELARGD